MTLEFEKRKTAKKLESITNDLAPISLTRSLLRGLISVFITVMK